MIQLIVNADDFGLHESVNHGIIQGHQKGIITSTSLLASGPAFEEAVSLAKENPNLGIGIHTCLVGGLEPVLPASEVSSLLTEEGVFPLTYIDFMKMLYRGHINYQELYKELRAQFEKICRTGLPITHVDGHQHLHVLPRVLPIILALSKELGISAMRIPQENLTFTNGVHNPIRWAGKIGLSQVAKSARRLAEDMHIAFPNYFWGMINGGQLKQEALMGILREVAHKQGVHEIMTHPGANTGRLGQCFSWGYHWEDELAAMCSSASKDYLASAGIKLINFGDLP